MNKVWLWILKKLIGNTPVIMNVTITTSGISEIKGSKMEGIFDKWHVVSNEEDEQ